MNKLKEINQYLLENYPITWHSKFLQLLVAGIFGWIISFISGYLLFGLNELKYRQISDFYFDSSFVSFHVIYCLIIICIWAIFYYKNNAIKSFYPLGKLYFVKLFTQLFIAFSLLVSAYYPFTYGTMSTVKNELKINETETEIAKLNLGATFVLNSNSMYHIANNKQVVKNKLSSIYYNESSKIWEGENSYYYYPTKLNDTYSGKNLFYGDFGDLHDSLSTQIDNYKYLFFKTVNKFESIDSCESNVFVTDFIQLPNSGKLHVFDFQNLNANGLEFQSFFTQKYTSELIKNKVLHWSKNHQFDSIQFAINDFIDVCMKYKIDLRLDSQMILKYLKLKDFHHVASITSQYENHSNNQIEINDFSSYPEDYNVLMKYSNNDLAVSEEDRSAFITAIERQDIYFYEKDQIINLLDNYEMSHTNRFNIGFVTVLFIGFFLAFLFVLFEFANIVSFLITIPIGGVLMILVALGLIFINLSGNYNYENYDYHAREKNSIVFVFCIVLIIVGTTIYGVLSKRFNKKVLNVFVNMTYIISPFFINLIFGMNFILSGHYVYTKCGEEYLFGYPFITNPYWVLLFALIGLFSFFPLIKKYKALED
jgi:hypothetical protein